MNPTKFRSFATFRTPVSVSHGFSFFEDDDYLILYVGNQRVEISLPVAARLLEKLKRHIRFVNALHRKTHHQRRAVV
jgi:hypothetical protein